MAQRSTVPLMKNMDIPADEEEGEIPLVEAVAIDAPPDPDPNAQVVPIDASKAKTLDFDGGTNDPTRRVFQVIAPSDLPKGYRLNAFVEETQEEVVVLVPSGGVKKSQTFEGKEAGPLIGHWSDEVLDCSPNYEGSFYYVAFCCAAAGWGIVAEKICCHDPIVAKLMPWLLGALALLYWIFIYFLEFDKAKLLMVLLLLSFTAT